MKDLANLNYSKACNNFREYFKFKKMIEDFANLPESKRKNEFERPNIFVYRVARIN